MKFKHMRTSLLLLFIVMFFMSCGEYQKILKNPDAGMKFTYAENLYLQEKYKKALKLMEQIVPVYRGKPQAEKLMYIYANTYFNLEDYYLAGYQFERFAISYPKSDSVELASYKSAISYYELSPIYSLDQKDTYTGLEKLQNFIDIYPNSEYRVEANEKVKILTEKLERKAIETAKQYNKISDFKSAIASFDNFISDFPGSIYRKDAFYGRLNASYRLALRSVPSKVNKRLNDSKEYYENFVKYFSNTDLMTDADEIMIDIDKRLLKIKTETSS
ncbi:MAG: outer membrane protein assembly factor BamD [Flavobacteriaceae bacterium]|nr:outer membrane protein assembly factor BamD [Flavobacteriaceae bacterium]